MVWLSGLDCGDKGELTVGRALGIMLGEIGIQRSLDIECATYGQFTFIAAIKA